MLEAVKLWVTNVVFLAIERPVPLAETPRVVVKAVAATEVRVVLVETMRTERVVVVPAGVEEEEEPMVVVTMAGAVVLIVTVVVAVPVGEADEVAEEEEPPVSLNWPE